jgi:nucleotide-binding universal stress UspA family protein
MIATVAVGTDGSETAKQAVRMAGEVAKRFDAKVVLLSAYDGSLKSRRPSDPEGQWSYNPAGPLKEMLKRSEEDLRAMGVDATTHLDEGEPAEVIVRLAEECGADVLVVGNVGMQRRVLGSVPNTVTHKAPCSVLVVKTT